MWGNGVHQQDKKAIKLINDAKTHRFCHPTTTTTTTTSPLLSQPTSPVPPPNPNTHHPSISSLEDWTALIEHSSVYRSTLPIGFWINGIIFLIKQDGAEEGGGGKKGGTGLWACE